MIYSDDIWGFNYMYIEIGDLRTFLGGHMEALVDPWQYVFEEVVTEVGTQEVICRSLNYQDIFGGSFSKDIMIMVYDMLGKT